MSDLDDIRTTIARYCHLCDDGRFDEFADLFEPDAAFVVLGAVHTGRDAIRDFMTAAQGPEARGKHVTANCVVDLDVGGASAQAVTDYVFLARRGDGIGITSVGRYHDRLRRGEDGRWRFARREIVFMGDQPAG